MIEGDGVEFRWQNEVSTVQQTARISVTLELGSEDKGSLA